MFELDVEGGACSRQWCRHSGQKECAQTLGVGVGSNQRTSGTCCDAQAQGYTWVGDKAGERGLEC